MTNTEIILASRSPRRSKLLKQIGVRFKVRVSDVDEIIPDDMPPAQIVQHLARQKAASVSSRYPDSLTIGADTIVVLDDKILGKPTDAGEATRMLTNLSDRTHFVYTGIALSHPRSQRHITASEATEVTFSALSVREIDAYVRTGSPMDKAGAYGIQDDRGALFISGIRGDYYNVVGLPLHRLYQVIMHNFTDLFVGDSYFGFFS